MHKSLNFCFRVLRPCGTCTVCILGVDLYLVNLLRGKSNLDDDVMLCNFLTMRAPEPRVYDQDACARIGPQGETWEI